MYLNYYNFKKEPFQITPDPEFLFLSPSHKEALASIIYGIEGKKGFVAIVGSVGVGKTTILRSYLEKVDKNAVKIVYIFNANVSFSSLLKTIYQDLAIERHTDDVFLMVNRLHEVLIEEYKKGFTVVLIIDEAQNMPIETLENLRMLSNLETATEKLIQIVLLGQPEFDEMLNRHELRQLKQRIAIHTTISPLTKEDSLRYIEHRLSKVTTHEEPVFTKGALNEIVQHAKGIPRVINIVCDNAFITGYGYQKKPVTKAIIKEIITDFGGKKGAKEEKRKREYFFRWRAAAAILIFAGLAFGFWRSPFSDIAWEQFRHQVGTVMENPVQSQAKPAANRAEAAAGVARGTVPQESEVPPPTVAAAPQRANKDVKAATSDNNSNARRERGPKRVVERGDTLSRLVLEKYGFVDNELLQKVKRLNPAIKDVNKIYIGDTIVFPDGTTATGFRTRR